MAKGLWVVLNVDNLEKSVEFYKRIGLKARVETQGPMTWGSVNTSSAESGLMLWNKNIVAPGQAEDTRAWLSGDLGKGVLISVGVPNATKLWSKVQAARVTVDQPLRQQEWGGSEFTIVDPDGYVVNFSDKFPSAPKKKAKPATRKGPKGRTKTKAAKTKQARRRA